MDGTPARRTPGRGGRGGSVVAVRPRAFGVRMRDRGRTVTVKTQAGGRRRYVVEDSRGGGKPRRREHLSLSDALRDLAATWRHRLN